MSQQKENKDIKSFGNLLFTEESSLYEEFLLHVSTIHRNWSASCWPSGKRYFLNSLGASHAVDWQIPNRATEGFVLYTPNSSKRLEQECPSQLHWFVSVWTTRESFEQFYPHITWGRQRFGTRNHKRPIQLCFHWNHQAYNERILKDALLNNITKFLTELGTGFAYVGKEYRLQIGEKENFIDLLFYNLNLSCYIVLEVKIGSFTFADVGQLGGYVVACNHLLRKEGRDNPTIGLLICKEKDRIQAQYALESSSQPIAISEYDLEKFYPEKLEGTMPTIEEWEAKFGGSIEHE